MINGLHYCNKTKKKHQNLFLYIKIFITFVILAGGFLTYNFFSFKKLNAKDVKSNGINRAEISRLFSASKDVVRNDSHLAVSAPNKTTDARTIKNVQLIVQEAKKLEIKRDFTGAKVLFAQAAEAGDAYSKYRLGFFAEHGLGGARDGDSALKWYEDAADSGYIDAPAVIAEMYLGGGVVDADQVKMKFYLDQALNVKSPEGMFFRAALIFKDQGMNEDALNNLMEAAREGNANALRFISNLFATGQKEFPKDSSKAIEWAAAAIEEGSTEAKLELAELLAKHAGGVSQEILSKLIEVNEDSRNGRASLDLAYMLFSKKGVDANDIRTARDYAIDAYDLGQSQAAFTIAATYSAARDYESVINWLEAGKKNGDWRSNYALMLISQPGADLRQSINIASTAEYKDLASLFLNQSQSSPESRAPSPINMPTPQFPAGLSTLAINSEVTVQFIVNTDGRTSSIKVVSSTVPELNSAAITAVQGWTFEPARKNGRAVPARMKIPITFSSTK